MRCRFALEVYLQRITPAFDPETTPTYDDFLEYSENFMLGSTRDLEVTMGGVGNDDDGG